MKGNFTKGLIKENPVFVFLLGMCPALAVTQSVEGAFGMGILVVLVLMGSNAVVSLLKNIIPDEIRIPAYIVIIATFVTMIQMLTNAFAASLADSLGVFISLIVVNCLVLGRAESFASKNGIKDSVLDGIGMGLGFTLALVTIALFRELLGTGAIMYGDKLPLPVSGEIRIIPEEYAIMLFTQAPGAFLTLGIILAVINSIRIGKETRLEEEKKRRIELKKQEAVEKKKIAAQAVKSKTAETVINETLKGATA